MNVMKLADRICAGGSIKDFEVLKNGSTSKYLYCKLVPTELMIVYANLVNVLAI